MAKDEHGIDIEEDTALDTADGPNVAEQAEAERDRRSAEHEANEEANRQEVDRESEAREDRVREAENPDAHRDEEPFVSE